MIDEIDVVDAIEIEDAPEVFPLAADEQQMLERCELIIDQGLQTYIEVGRAMATIRDGKLYRQHYDTWEEYCVDRWGMSRARAYQLIDASKTADALSTIVDTSKIPESHMREVAKANPANRPRVFERATELAGGEKRTARHIEQAREEIERPDLPIEFAVAQRRFEARGHVLSAAWDGHTQRFVVRKDGGTGVVMLWPDVVSALARIEAQESPPAQVAPGQIPQPDPAVEMEIKRLCAISGSKYLGTPSLPYPTATRYRIAKFSGGGGDYLADEALEQLRDECDKRSAAVQQQIAPAPAAPPPPAWLPPVPVRPKRPVSADASAVIVYLKHMETYASALEAVIMELQKRMATED